MKTLLATAALMMLVTGAAQAADALAPVRAVVIAADPSGAEVSAAEADTFSDAHLARLFSKAFAAQYRAAGKHPAYDDGSNNPFDYDVIAGGQDSCPIIDLTISAAGRKGKATDVVARFRNRYCFGEDAMWQGFTELHFRVIEERGKAVIDDIIRAPASDRPASLRAEMAEIAKD